jgi:glycosyltransferase involved in cell wall biosynthesis
MSKLLTIAIPTYNHAELLDQQLSWLERSIQGFESDCEVLVADNCSTDDTQEIIDKWQQKLINLTFKYHRHPENLGVMNNIMYCLNSSATQYVWAIGDHDPIQDRTIADVIDILKQQQNLSLLFLNFSGRNKITGHPVYPPTIIGNRWFDADDEDGGSDGKAIFEACLAKSLGAVIFLTANIYRTDLVKDALQNWSDAANNWMSLAYLAGYCAAHGNVFVTKKTYLECIFGATVWHKKPKAVLLMQYKHIPEMISKLAEIGYSQEFCRQMMLRLCQEVDLKVLLEKLRRWPVAALRTVIPFLVLISLTAFDVNNFQ